VRGASCSGSGPPTPPREPRHEPTPNRSPPITPKRPTSSWDQLATETRLEIAEFRVRRLQDEIRALTDDTGVLPVPLHVRSRIATLEQANATLTSKLDQATTYIRDLTEQLETMRARLNHPTNRRPEDG